MGVNSIVHDAQERRVVLTIGVVGVPRVDVEAISRAAWVRDGAGFFEGVFSNDTAVS